MQIKKAYRFSPEKPYAFFCTHCLSFIKTIYYSKHFCTFHKSFMLCIL